MTQRTNSFTTRGIAVVCAALMLANIVLALMLSSQSEGTLTEQVRARMLDVARSAAGLLDGDALAGLEEGDVGSEDYERVMDTLRAFQENSELIFIYILRPTAEGGFEFIIDADMESPADFGEPAHYTDALVEAATGTVTADLVPYEDRWGRFYSAYAPVYGRDGSVTSIVCVDYDAAWYEEHIARTSRFVVFNCFGSVTLAVLAVIIAMRISTAERRHQESLQEALRYDTLTGLPKMDYFFDLAEVARKDIIGAGAEPTFLYVDLVGMKFYNQSHGFAQGDMLLKEFAKTLAGRFDAARCSRFGQDQFAVVTYAERIDRRLQLFFRDCARLNSGDSLPVRVGIYRESMGAVDIATSCDRAKAANTSKWDARRSVYAFFDEAMLGDIRRRQYVADNIDRAIAQGWIQVYYQPIVRAANGRVCDEESLARWVDPERGMLAPADFVPALEQTKLVYKLDLYVLEQTLRKMRHLDDIGLFVVPCSINLSRSDFEMCDMVEEVRRRVDDSGFSRDMINIEITETAIGSDFEFMKAQVERFQELGFQVWMDDFGSKYSSLDNLQRIHFDLIKFDMRFMQQFDRDDQRSKIILTELTRMAIGLGIDTICEGVETQDQVDFLREVGCSKLQGYFFTRPLPMEAVLKRYEEGTAIGFENPAESGYYTALGRVSLYDLSSIAREGDESLEEYFDTLPMALFECSEDEFKLVRSNKSHRQFMARTYGLMPVGVSLSLDEASRYRGPTFKESLFACREGGERIVVDDTAPNGTVLTALMQRVAINPVTGTVAVAVVILAAGEG